MEIKLGSPRGLLLLFALLIAECSSGFEFTMVFSAMPTFNRVFGDPVSVGWLVTIFLLVGAAVTAIGARLGDIYGRRRVLTSMLVIALVGSLISAQAHDLTWVIVGRGIQGIAGAILALCCGLARENFAPAKVPMAIGAILAAASVAAGAGLVVGGYIVDRFAWQGIFEASAVLALAGVVLVMSFVPKSPVRPASGSLDYLGAILFMPPVAGLLYAISKGKAWGWSDPRILWLVAGSVLLLAWWAWHELKLREPLIDVRLFKIRKVALANLTFGLLALGSLQMFFLLSLFLQQPISTGVGLGLTATMAGTLMLPSQVAGVVSSPLSGWIASRWGARQAAVLGSCMLIVAWTALAIHHQSVWFVAVAGTVIAMGQNIAYVACPNLIVEAVPHERTSEATGVLQVVRATATALGAQLVTVLLATSTVAPLAGAKAAYPSETAYLTVFGAIVAVSVVMLVAVLSLPRQMPRHQPSTPGRPGLPSRI